MDSQQGYAVELAPPATLWFTRLEGSHDDERQAKELLKHLRQGCGFIRGKDIV
jgi:hypothetical protein